MGFSVLMSIYYKEKPDNFAQCMDSLLAQTSLPDEIVLVEDGRLTDELYKVIDEYAGRMGNINFVRLRLDENRGLGIALSYGIKHCRNRLVARMDTDDIAVKDRFAMQLKAFSKNPSLDIVGGYIDEFIDEPDKPYSVRMVPISQKDIYKYQRRRDAFNHMTVMYKKNTVIEAGNYKDCLLMEDSLLWAEMIKNHAHMANIPKVLVHARCGDDMIDRRGGIDYFFKYKNGRKHILKTGTISYADYCVTVAAQFVVCIMPTALRRFIFKKILRK